MNNRIISINLTLEEIDVVLNALQEKAINISNLRQNIIDIANNQISAMNKSEEKQKEGEDSGKH